MKRLWVDRVALDLVAETAKEILLGIITRERRVRLKVADPVRCPGHAAWIERESIADAAGGFSVLVKAGRVVGIFPRSILNAGPHARLSEADIAEVRRLLPCARSARVLE